MIFRIRGISMQTNATSRALAVAVWPESVNRALQTVVLVVAGTAVLAISAKIQVPFWPVPMTLQTLAVMAIAAAYGSNLAVATVIAYIAEGLAGIPVFAGAAAGPAYVLGATGGFLLAFVVGAAIVGFAADRGDSRSTSKLFIAMVIADVVIFALGLIWLGAAVPKVGYSAKLLSIGLYPFALGDLLKIVLASLLIPAVWGMVGKK
jgi:biotin transport system substrate-specific component